MQSRYKDLYNREIKDSLYKELGVSNVHQVPRLLKIVINMGVGKNAQDKKIIDGALSDLKLISGQKPIVTKAKKSESAFKLREGMDIGCKVTLRNIVMYNFLEKLVCVALPRVKQFQGLNSKSFDGRGNFSFGISEQIIFPEIDYDKVDMIRGMDITLVTSTEIDSHALLLLKKFDLPFYN